MIRKRCRWIRGRLTEGEEHVERSALIQNGKITLMLPWGFRPIARRRLCRFSFDVSLGRRSRTTGVCKGRNAIVGGTAVVAIVVDIIDPPTIFERLQVSDLHS
jgi:hypothetical protein